MEDKKDENKDNKDNQDNQDNQDKSNNELQNYQQKIKELNNKINVLIKGVKEEREKTKKLSKEIEVLNLDKILKDETISKLKSENDSLNLILSKDDPKSYFENITKLNNDINFNPEEYDLMKKENVKIKEENKILMEQNSILKNKIEKITEERKLVEKNLNEEIYKLKKERIEQSNDIYDKLKKIELLNKLYKEIEAQKNKKDMEIIKYKEEEKKFNDKMKDLENQIKLLQNKNDDSNEQINILKKQIEERIKIDIDKYIFNEKELYNKIIKIKFSSTDINIKLNFDNKDLEVDAKNIRFTFYEKTKDKVIIFYEMEEEETNTIKGENKEDEKKEDNKIEDEKKEDNKIIEEEKKEENINKEEKKDNEQTQKNKCVTNVMLCRFSERECNYIFDFKKEMMKKYKENKKIIEEKEKSFSRMIFGFFND